jgi:hypothetical protein
VASVYAYVDSGGPAPKEILLSGYLNKYGGAINVLGRPLGIGEMRRMTTCDNLILWYRERETTVNIAEWSKSNPNQAEFLNQAHRWAVEFGMIPKDE